MIEYEYTPFSLFLSISLQPTKFIHECCGGRVIICPSETVLLSNLGKDDEQWHLFATTLKEDELPR